MIVKLREVLKPLIPKWLFSIYRNIRSTMLYAGNTVECSVCGGQFGRMRDYRMPNRSSDGELCPRCGAKSRHRLYALYFKHRNIINGNLRILHIAPDPGIRQMIEPENQYISADLLVKHVHVNVNIQQLAFADDFFDVIVCSHVLEHVDDDRQAMKDLCRVLKPNGWALLQTPLHNPDPDVTYEDKSIIDPEERLKHFGQEDHVRLYGVNDFYRRLRDAGFTIEENFVETLTDEVKQRYVLKDRELIIGIKSPSAKN